MAHRRSTAGISGAALVTASLIAFWVQLEGEKLVPYRDIAGIWTVCSGHTGPDVIPGKAWTKAQCKAATEKDLIKYSLVVYSCVTAPILEPQREALVVMAGNIGEYAFCDSTLVKKINRLDYEGAEVEFQRWANVRCNVKCVHSPGLLNRRMLELARFKLQPTQIAGNSPSIN